MADHHGALFAVTTKKGKQDGVQVRDAFQTRLPFHPKKMNSIEKVWSRKSHTLFILCHNQLQPLYYLLIPPNHSFQHFSNVFKSGIFCTGAIAPLWPIT